MSSRIFIVFAGTWLIVSTFAWPHTHAQIVNTAVIGALFMVFSLLSLIYGPARYLCLASAAWLLLSTLRMTTLSSGTLWNNGIMAAAVFFSAMMIGEPQEIRHDKQLYGRIRS